MTTIANIAVAIVALLHVYFLVLEVFLWQNPIGLRTFGMTPEFAAASRSLASAGDAIKIFFLSFLVVAGVFGALTVNRKIVWVQALPSGITLAPVLLA
jgi:putative membrane protein